MFSFLFLEKLPTSFITTTTFVQLSFARIYLHFKSLPNFCRDSRIWALNGSADIHFTSGLPGNTDFNKILSMNTPSSFLKETALNFTWELAKWNLSPQGNVQLRIIFCIVSYIHRYSLQLNCSCPFYKCTTQTKWRTVLFMTCLQKL